MQKQRWIRSRSARLLDDPALTRMFTEARKQRAENPTLALRKAGSANPGHTLALQQFTAVRSLLIPCRPTGPARLPEIRSMERDRNWRTTISLGIRGGPATPLALIVILDEEYVFGDQRE